MPNCINLLVVNFLDFYLHTPFSFSLIFKIRKKKKKKYTKTKPIEVLVHFNIIIKKILFLIK